MRKKIIKLRLWSIGFKIINFLVYILPLGIFFLNNFDRYVRTAKDVVKLSAGAIVIIVILFFMVLGKLKMPGRLVMSVLFMGLCWLFNSMLSDLLIISALWCVSEVLDYVIVSPISKMLKRRLSIQETAYATALANKAVTGGSI